MGSKSGHFAKHDVGCSAPVRGNDVCNCTPAIFPEREKHEQRWERRFRPGYFGRRRDEKIASLNSKYGEGNWQLRWYTHSLPEGLEFVNACIVKYEFSYLMWLQDRPDDLDFICSYGECIDNAMTNIESGLDYTKQEAFSTHIQDIAIRNVLNFLGMKFEGPKDKILVIRSADTEGYRFGPGNVPFYDLSLIEKPSKAPQWANPGSVEDFWQSNKFVYVRK